MIPLLNVELFITKRGLYSLPEELSERFLVIILLPSEDDDGPVPETKTRHPNGLQGAVQQVFPSHMNVGFGILIQVLLSK